LCLDELMGSDLLCSPRDLIPQKKDCVCRWCTFPWSKLGCSLSGTWYPLVFFFPPPVPVFALFLEPLRGPFKSFDDDSLSVRLVTNPTDATLFRPPLSERFFFTPILTDRVLLRHGGQFGERFRGHHSNSPPFPPCLSTLRTF